MVKMKPSIVIFSLIQHLVICGSIPPPPLPEIEISKCCDDSEYLYMSDIPRCERDNKISPWKPIFIDPMNKEQPQVIISYQSKIGKPKCQSREPWPVLDYVGSCDKLILMPNGKLRHYVFESQDEMRSCSEELESENLFVDFNTTDYCIDQTVHIHNNKSVIGQIALICVPKNDFPWHDMYVIVKKIVNPIFHIIAIACFLIVAIVYVVLPQLFDLVGNIITSLAMCMIFVQTFDIVKMFVEYHSEMSYLISDSLMYISNLAVFFWLNSLGYYIWKTFRSRNVFLRVTDGRKYCCYSVYAWGATFSMAAMALFAHVVLDTNTVQRKINSAAEAAIDQLGIAVFLITISFTIFINVFFCLSTAQIISRMSTYGRIHHKLMYSFRLFVKLFIIISCNWFIYILSWFPINSFFYFHVFFNLFQAIFILYATVLSVKKVRFLLSKACCYEKCVLACCRPGDPSEMTEWGEEMMAMNIRN